jgi:tRNA (guanine-N7-)-methyltransferase
MDSIDNKYGRPDNKPMFYGRRKGKPLRPTKLEAYEELLPQMQIALPPSGTLDIAALFPVTPEKIWMEIGFGDGEHLLYQAQEHPRIGMIGCEPFVNGIAALCNGIKKNSLNNLRIWPEDARILLKRLPDNCLDRLFLLNSDPWPKTRHHNRRFVQQETLDDIHRILKPAAQFRMSTDHPDLAVWQLEKTFFHGGFEWTATSHRDWTERPSDLPETRYQKKGAHVGRPTTFLDFIRK